MVGRLFRLKMSASSIDSKIQVLEARLKAENESRDRDVDLHHGTFAVPRPGSGRKPRILSLKPDGTPTRSRKQLDLPMAGIIPNTITEPPDSKLEEIMKMSGILNVNGALYKTDFLDLEHIGELGNGTCGHVVKMLHKPSTNVIAVKQMRRSGNTEENKRIIMDLEVVLKSHDCPYIVQCLGCFISAADVWICMELMATCFDKLLKRLKKPIPEHILGKVTVATVNALSYLKEQHGVIHRDVKPSNILLDERGRIKLCDFGISGRLVDSKARTRSAGCAAYMAPERIDPPDPNYPDYDIRADVWSLGITLVELATGSFPYLGCSTDFEVLARVINEDPPSLPIQGSFSKDFQEFVKLCLTKNPQDRPKYAKLLKHPFVKHYDKVVVNVDVWFSQALQQADMISKRRFTPPPPSPNSRRHFAFHSRNSSESRITPDPIRSQLDSRINNSEVPVPLSNGTLNYNNLELRTNNGSLRHFMPNDFTSDSQPSVQNGSNEQKVISNNLPPINRTNKLNSATIYQDSRIPIAETHQDRYAKNYERQVSPYMQRRPLPESEQPDGFWQVPQGSPLANRKRLQVFPDRYNLQDTNRPLSGNTSPILMNRLYHQRHQAQSHSPPITYPITNQQQFMAHELQLKTAPHSHIPVHMSASPTTNEKEQAGLWGSVTGAMKRRFASCIKVQLGGHSKSAQNNQDDGGGGSPSLTHSSPRYSSQSPPTGIIGSLDRRRHQSPDPPPRLNRGVVGSSSPLAMRRNFLDMNSGSGSPSFARRYPTAPQPPPRRLSESSSTPGSPQHLRTRLHYTPEPLRRHYPPPELS